VIAAGLVTTVTTRTTLTALTAFTTGALLARCGVRRLVGRARGRHVGGRSGRFGGLRLRVGHGLSVVDGCRDRLRL
jgi:hypothetical protein